jgi:hypothetical protein
MERNGQDEPVEVWRAWGAVEVELVQTLLRGRGIESAVRGESTRLTHGFTLDGLAVARILVRKEDAEHAEEIIADGEGMTRCAECRKPVRVDDEQCWSCGAPRTPER